MLLYDVPPIINRVKRTNLRESRGGRTRRLRACYFKFTLVYVVHSLAVGGVHKEKLALLGHLFTHTEANIDNFWGILARLCLASGRG